MATRTRLVTWNIHKGIGTDRRYALDRTIAVLRQLRPDIACLQEVDHGVSRSAFENQKKRLRRELGFPHAALALNVKVERGGYGNLILSRLPIVEFRNVDLTIPPKKRRSGLVARLSNSEGQTWILANVHLGLLHLERRFQARRLLEHLTSMAAPGEGVVIAGDWNEWRSRLVKRVMREEGYAMATPTGSTRAAHTWPSRRPVLALDRVLYRPPMRCVQAEPVLNGTTRVASDHLPLCVEFEGP